MMLCLASGLGGVLAAADEIFWGLASEERLFGEARQAGVDRVHYLGVGVGAYQDASYSALPNASRDPVDLAAALTEVARTGELIVLTDAAATRAGLEAAIACLAAAAGSDDLVIFHFSGHGVGLVGHRTGARRGMLLLHEAPPFEDLARGDAAQGAVTLEEVDTLLVAAGLRAKQQWYLLDACYGGLAALPVRLGSKAVDPAMARFLSRQPGALLMTAGGAAQVVLDGGEGAHGLLTGWWIEALRADSAAREAWAVELDGAPYLAVEHAYPAFRNEIFATAGEIWAGTEGRRARTPAPGSDATPQVPKMTPWSGETLILLPLKRAGTVAAEVDVVAKAIGAPAFPLAALFAAAGERGDAPGDPVRSALDLRWVRPGSDEPARSAPLRPFRIGDDWRFFVELVPMAAAAVAYDLIVIDDRGLVQWLAPTNETWTTRFPGAGPMAFGPGTVAAGDSLRLPPAVISPGFSQAGEAGRRMWLFLALHAGEPATGWREALAEASRQSADRFAAAIAEGVALPARSGVAEALEPLRRAGWQSVRLRPGSDRATVETRAATTLLGWAWEVAPSGQAAPLPLWKGP